MTLLDTNELAVPSVVAYELEYGTLKAKGPAAEKSEPDCWPTAFRFPFDHEAAGEAARIRIELEKQGAVIGPMDLLIAGTATSRGAILVTNNTRAFSRVRGLRLADWTR